MCFDMIFCFFFTLNIKIAGREQPLKKKTQNNSFISNISKMNNFLRCEPIKLSLIVLLSGKNDKVIVIDKTLVSQKMKFPHKKIRLL